ncbi:MAG: NAD(P)/FAD-dependent oxidoreductase [Saprospirales bacterium]|nr:NAD(P)/FAD-dependent oxidoreductase [Saprospirales bacterium]
MYHKDETHKVLIIGGGAAGFFAAITCAEENPEAEVLILEKGKDVLGKVKVSGGGRCNVTNGSFDPRELVKNYPRGGKALLGPFHRFCTGDTMEWFESRGVPLKVEDDGRVFPVSNSSQSIIDCLQSAAHQAGVKIVQNQRVAQLYPPEEKTQRWKVMTGSGEAFFADKIMLASGSSNLVWEMIRHLGHTIVPPVPSLFTFNVKDPRITDLPGVSVPQAQVRIQGTNFKAEGPLLITHWGFSGPGILRLSAWAARELNEMDYQFQILINWAFPIQLHELQEQLPVFKEANARKPIFKHNPTGMPQRLWRRLVEQLGIDPEQPWGNLGKKAVNQLTQELSAGAFSVTGKSTFKDEFVTAGGIDLNEVDFKTFESKIHKGLHFAGEVLNIDAITGGFNFQAAWTGGWIAGQALAERD